MPHEVAAALANGTLGPRAFDDDIEHLVAATLVSLNETAAAEPSTP